MVKKNATLFCLVLGWFLLLLELIRPAWASAGGPAGVTLAAPAWGFLPWGLGLVGCVLAVLFAALPDGKRGDKKNNGRSDDSGAPSSDFERVADVLGEFIWQIDRKGRFVYTNSAVNTLLGYKPDEIIGRFFYDLCHPYERQAVQQILTERLRQKKTFKQFLKRLQHKDGSYVIVESSGAPVLDAAGEPTGLCGISRDVTEGKQAEESIRMLAQFPAENPDPMMRVDIKGTVIYANPASRGLCATIGFRKGEIVPESWRRPILKALSSGRSQESEVEVEDRVLSLVIAPASAAAAVHIYGRDITERKQAQQKLEESEKRYQDLYDNAPDLYMTLDIAGKIKSVNQYGADYLGYTTDELLDRSIWDLIHSDDHKQIKAWMKKAGSQGLKQSELEHRLMRRDGTFLWVLMHSRMIVNAEGKIKEWRTIYRDITETRRSREQMQLAAQVLENSIEGIQVTDASGMVQMVNPAFTFITGYSSEVVVGEEGFITRMDEADSSVVEDMWAGLKGKGRWSGEVWSRRKDGEAYPKWLNVSVIKDSLGNVVNYICIFRDMTFIKHREEKIKYLANHDPLTGLPNRLLFEDRLDVALARAERHRGSLALLFIDLDDFKLVNDRLGHAMGDLLLQQLAGRLVACVRGEDTVARFGGDEFLMILQGIKDTEDAEEAARRVLGNLDRPFLLKGQEVSVSASVGITIYPQDGKQPDVLIKNADLAMYGAKAKGQNKFNLFTSDLNSTP